MKSLCWMLAVGILPHEVAAYNPMGTSGVRRSADARTTEAQVQAAYLARLEADIAVDEARIEAKKRDAQAAASAFATIPIQITDASEDYAPPTTPMPSAKHSPAARKRAEIAAKAAYGSRVDRNSPYYTKR